MQDKDALGIDTDLDLGGHAGPGSKRQATSTHICVVKPHNIGIDIAPCSKVPSCDDVNRAYYK